MLKIKDRFLLILFSLIVLYFMFIIFGTIDLSSVKIDATKLMAVNTVFLSILMQAFPFILIGVFVSSILQVIIPNETLVRIFPRKKGLGFIVAIFAGVLFPLCDCAIVPVAARLIKKGVAIPVAITFMLSAPLVNPIVIASTLYAFPGQPVIALYRIYFGVTVALVVGLMFVLFPNKSSIIKREFNNRECNCGHGHSHVNVTSKKGLTEKFKDVITHASSEFFEVGKFLIVGAFLSSIFQTLISKDIFNNLFGHKALSLLIMMVAAFVFSVCSTSDAFIGKSFLSQFTIGSVMGFLILGPMIDIKNMLMLLSSFKKGFVLKLVAFIFICAFVLLYLQTQFVFIR